MAKDSNSISHTHQSNVDCFHPNDKAHSWIARIFWNNLFKKPAEKSTKFTYDADLEVSSACFQRPLTDT